MTDPMELVGRLEAAVTAMQRRADDGWKMMPSVPNDDMTEALERCESYCDSCHGNAFSGWSGYEAMFKAAPDAILTLSTLTEAAACIREMVEWRPIETAPRDGSRFIGLLKSGRAVTISCRKHHNGFVQKPDGGWVPNGTFDNVWCEEEAGAIVPRTPSHWLPLPPAPGAEA